MLLMTTAPGATLRNAAKPARTLSAADTLPRMSVAVSGEPVIERTVKVNVMVAIEPGTAVAGGVKTSVGDDGRLSSKVRDLDGVLEGEAVEGESDTAGVHDGVNDAVAVAVNDAIIDEELVEEAAAVAERDKTSMMDAVEEDVGVGEVVPVAVAVPEGKAIADGVAVDEAVAADEVELDVVALAADVVELVALAEETLDKVAVAVGTVVQTAAPGPDTSPGAHAAHVVLPGGL
jgi:hypothetical protein